MVYINKVKRSGVILIVLLLITACGSSSGTSSNGGGSSGSTLSGDVATFTASLDLKKKSFFAQVKEFIYSTAYAAVSGVTVSVGSQSTTTDASGNFTLNNIDTGDQTVTFTQGTDSATYTLNGVDAAETFTLNDVNIDGSTVSTALTGTWTGTIEFDEGVNYTMTMTISANGNSLSGTLVTGDETGTFSGSENGSSLQSTTYEVTSSEGCVLGGPLTGTFSGTTFEGNAPVTSDTCGLQPGDDDPDGHPFTLTKT